MQLDLKEVEELSKTLYIRALKLLPNDIKQGFERLLMEETDITGKTILGTMVISARTIRTHPISPLRTTPACGWPATGRS
jgi:hypothetical protein